MFLESCMIHCSIQIRFVVLDAFLTARIATETPYFSPSLQTIELEWSPGDTICIGESSRTDFEAELPVLAIIILDPLAWRSDQWSRCTWR